MPQTSTWSTSRARSQSASPLPSAVRPSNAEYAAAWLALEEDRVERLRVEVGVERLAVGADPAVHRPGVDEVGLTGPVVAGVDVVVLARHHDVVRRRPVVAAGPVVEELADVAGHPRPAATGSDPPSQKSFWTSTTISARVMGRA